MRPLKRFFARLLNFTTGRRGDQRIQEEMESHLAAQTEENIRAGMTPGDALRHARLKFGAAEAVREDYRAEGGLPWVENLLLDVRYALRGLRKSPAFTLVAVFTLMLGIGANVVVFGVLNAILLHPLAVRDPSSLVQIRPRQWTSGRLLTTSYPAFEDFRERNHTFGGMAAIYAYSHARLLWGKTVADLRGYEVTGNYFDLLGVQPEIGRYFHAADVHGPGSAPYVVLSDHAWRNVFHADRSVIGAAVDLDQHPFTVVGVAPPQFRGTERLAWPGPDYWMPMANMGSDYLQSRKSLAMVMGRLKPGVTPQQATENLDAIAVQLAREYPATDAALPLRLIHPGLYGDDGDIIHGFLSGVTVLALLVWAAACANLASLFAARVADRSRELALRAALGSSRGRLVRQLLIEAVMVSLMGGAAALAGAGALLGMLNRWNWGGSHLPVGMDARVYLAGLALSVGSALLFGTVPARQAWQSSPLRMMKGGPANPTRRRRVALRDWLLGAQIAICTLLVAASLVAVRSLARELHGGLGFQPQGVTLAGMDLTRAGQPGDVALVKEKEMIEAARSIPGVTAAGAINATPMSGGQRGIPIYRPGTVEFTLRNFALAAYVYEASPGYLDAAGTRLLEGRDVAWQDTAQTPDVAIVNETFARKMWATEPAIGQRFVLQGKLTEVVGVVEDGRYYHDLAGPLEAAVYLPLSQSEPGDAVFVVRSRRAPNEIAAALQRRLGNIEPNLTITIGTWTDALGDVLFSARAATVALGILGLLAVMLAVTGIFGMAAYNVSRRMKELGIRVALGARRPQVMRAAVGRPLLLLGTGAAVGLLSGAFASRLLGYIVYQANPRDPVVVGGAVLLMALLGVAASAIPALRAVAVDPSRLMRDE